MAETKRYPAYRAARIRWLPPVPEHWNEQRAKTFFREVDERSKTGQEELLSVSHITGVTPRSQKNVTMFKAASYVGSKLCRPGDIVINTLWAWMAALGTSKHAGIVSPAYGVYRPYSADSFNPIYLDYLLRTRFYVAEYIGRSTGIQSSRLRLYPNQFLGITLLQPPRSEQDQAVAYLRAKDAHIARFIKAKRDLISRLTERKQHIIDQALTRGFDTQSKLKPSGIEWLGEVPFDWTVCRLKTQLVANDGGCWGDDPVGSGGTPVLRSTEQEVDGSWRIESPALRQLTAHELHSKKLRVGDLVITKSSGSEKHIGKTSLVTNEVEELDCCFSNFMQRLRPKSSVSSKWVWYFLNSRIGRDQMAFGSNSTTGLGNLTREVIGNVWFALPPQDIQEQLVRILENELHPIDVAIEHERKQIQLIREYRDRLIADVVTGQVYVHGWQPNPDDVVNDEELVVLGDEQEGMAEEEKDDGEDRH